VDEVRAYIGRDVRAVRDVGDDDPRAACNQRPGNGLADAGGAAGHESRLAFQ